MKSESDEKMEYWLRGPVEDIPNLLQPAAHALLQSNKELKHYLINFPEDLRWEKVYNRASVGFHIQHMTGVLNRMMTYAEGKSLSDEQFEYLRNEGVENLNMGVEDLLADFEEQVNAALNYFKNIQEKTLTEKRFVGRKQLPSTVLGLLFHAAEHSQRHVGQLLVTVSVLKMQKVDGN